MITSIFGETGAAIAEERHLLHLELAAEVIIAFSPELLSGHIRAVTAMLPFVDRKDAKRTTEIAHLFEPIDLPQMDVEAWNSCWSMTEQDGANIMTMLTWMQELNQGLSPKV
jgi:hypothetical protein